MPITPLLPGYSAPTNPSPYIGPEGPEGDPGPTGPQGPAGAGGLYVEARSFAAADGTTDDLEALEEAVTAALTDGKGLHFAAGDYLVSEALIIESANRLVITSDEGARILFPSSDTNLTSSAAYDNNSANRRGGLYLRNCTDTHVHGLIGVGDDVETDIAKNTGMFISLYKCSRTLITGVRSIYGGGLINQTNHAEDYGTIVSNFYSYGARNSSRLGNGSRLAIGTFETPNTSGYDRVTVGSDEHGSSHGVYFFATSGSYSAVDNVTFLNTRKDAIKVSGSSAAIHTLSASRCIFKGVGYKSDGTSNGGACILMGADDNNAHNNLSISRCESVDCNAEVVIHGSRGVNIDGWSAETTVQPAAPKTAFFAISRYQAGSQPVEAVRVRGLVVTAPPSIGGTNIATSGITVTDVGAVTSVQASTIDIADSTFSWACNTAVTLARTCFAKVDVRCIGLTRAVSLNGDRSPRVLVDVIDAQSNNAQIQQTNVQWPIYLLSIGGGRFNTSNPSKVGIGDNAGGTSAVAYPLCGVSGHAQPSESRPEVVFAYGPTATDGTGWKAAGTTALGRVSASIDPSDTNGTITLVTASNVNNFRVGQRFTAATGSSGGGTVRSGTATVASKTSTTVTFTGTITGLTTSDYLFQAADTIEIGGTTLTFVSSGPTSTQFNSIATLITAIEAIGGGGVYTAADYGSTFATPVTTRHIRVRRVATSTSANVFYGRAFTYHPHVGVFLTNYATSQDRTYSRGHDTNRMVIWSQLNQMHFPPDVRPWNRAAQIAMRDGGPPLRVVIEAGDREACATMHWDETDITLDGTEEFSWKCV